jgi:hypothetical protein
VGPALPSHGKGHRFETSHALTSTVRRRVGAVVAETLALIVIP